MKEEPLNDDALGERKPFRARGAYAVRCPDCQLPQTACICAFRPALPAAGAAFWLMMHPNEYYKPTNTGRLIEECLPDSRRFRWHRLDPDPAFTAALEDEQYQPWIVFPAAPEIYEDRLRPFEITPGRKPAFLLLDGTWQQAGKMFRSSRYLDDLPVLSLQPGRQSGYGLRRAAHFGQLCTVEVAAELLRLVGDQASADWLDRYFRVFSLHYLAARSNFPVKEETEDMRLLRAWVARQSGEGAA